MEETTWPCESSEEEGPGPGRRRERGSREGLGEDINSHWLDIKGVMDGSSQENSINTFMDTRENMSMYEMENSHHMAKTKV